VPAAPREQVYSEADDLLSSIRENISRARERAQEFEPAGRGRLRAAEEAVEGFQERLSELAAREADPRPDMFIALDMLKRRLGRAQRTRDPGAQELLRENYEVLRRNLENEQLWGSGAATAQQELNAAWTPWLGRRRVYQRRLMADIGERGEAGWDPLLVADPGKMEALVRGFGRPQQELAEQALRRGTAERTQLMRALGEHYQAPPELQAMIGEATASEQRIGQLLGTLETEAGAAARLAELPGGRFGPAGIARGLETVERVTAPLAGVGRAGARVGRGVSRLAGRVGGPLAARAVARPPITPARVSEMLQQNPEQFGRFRPLLENAAQRSPSALSVMHHQLLQRHPEYRQMFERAEEQAEEQRERAEEETERLPETEPLEGEEIEEL
jgi:hypothetical protein